MYGNVQLTWPYVIVADPGWGGAGEAALGTHLRAHFLFNFFHFRAVFMKNDERMDGLLKIDMYYLNKNAFQ